MSVGVAEVGDRADDFFDFFFYIFDVFLFGFRQTSLLCIVGE